AARSEIGKNAFYSIPGDDDFDEPAIVLLLCKRFETAGVSSVDREMAVLNRETPRHVWRINGKRLTHEQFLIERDREPRVRILPIGQHHPSDVLVQDPPVEPFRIEHPHRSIFHVLWVEGPDREVKTDERSVRPVEKTGRRTVVL